MCVPSPATGDARSTDRQKCHALVKPEDATRRPTAFGENAGPSQSQRDETKLPGRSDGSGTDILVTSSIGEWSRCGNSASDTSSPGASSEALTPRLWVPVRNDRRPTRRFRRQANGRMVSGNLGTLQGQVVNMKTELSEPVRLLISPVLSARLAVQYLQSAAMLHRGKTRRWTRCGNRTAPTRTVCGTRVGRHRPVPSGSGS